MKMLCMYREFRLLLPTGMPLPSTQADNYQRVMIYDRLCLVIVTVVPNDSS